ncbi:carboxylesterase family protein [Altererythrobacter endophyticus]|uniref:Carboxylic ester hydrolase n=2 Tax=Altericroceibacterium endophyticum TaxID=1808508 RepID=A0A6I4T2R3_9SPHN|nr:carboxylesterase family protein [Altericroceibacterium endophyticum]
MVRQRALKIAVALMVSIGPVTTLDAQPITVNDGKIEGRRIAGGVHAYLGIPFAAPPVRDLRWRAPTPAEPWEGILHADRAPPQCMQPQRGILTNQYSGAEITSEDCLYLNVWAKPGLKEAPVIVYLHGGGFFVGSGSMPLYRGEHLAEKDVVVVNPNYRLGPLGLLAHPQLTEESPHNSSGDYGFLDQIAALRWVQENIAAFGGDPSNVTIVGQSAGSMSVLVLQASPLAAGLFDKAVGMSGALIGGAGPAKLMTLDEAEEEGLALQAVWGAQSLEDLRALPADRLVAPRSPGSPRLGPIEDGYVLPEAIDQIFARSEQNDVPLIVGFTKDEAFGGFGPVSGLEEYRKRARDLFGDKAPQFLELYPASSDEQAMAQARAASRDATMVSSMDLWARAQTETGNAPVYSYMFARPHSYAKGATIPDIDQDTAGAYHTSGVPFWLGTLESFNRFRTMREWTADDVAVSNSMMDLLVAFAKTGRPDSGKMSLPKFDAKEPELLEIGQDMKMAPWPEERKLNFFRNIAKQSVLASTGQD